MRILTNVLVFGLLVGITAGELVIVNAHIDESVLVSTLIGLAGVKVLFVAAFFQGLKDEPRSLSSLLLVGLLIASALLTISFLQLHPFH